MKLKFVTALLALSVVTGRAAAADAATSYSPPVETHAAHASSGAAQAKAALKAQRRSMKTADRELASDVRKALSRSGDVSMSHMSVLVNSGAVTLAGSVPEASQIERAQQRAQNVSGVTGVTSRLTIETAGR
ncbi:BON domain-containing protein [Paraburkholderia sp. CNPSo 3157]|uniref:BON domain-containing protein n=1 Tax=Paraburkholderia franconis TaxID=2654983 RepID=A0A7X1NJK2_9BURK|nr:BON domain-containing protein [Paraburkholderia franconis]MPW23135.1 BON domain-containing protein [Paraburkholderia franconis]